MLGRFISSFVAATLAGVSLTGCVTSSRTMVGDPGMPINTSDVAIYGHLPKHSKVVAFVRAHVYWPLFWSDQAKTDAAIEALAVSAAEVGANGLLIRNFHPAAPEPFGRGQRAFRGAAGKYEFGHRATVHALAIRTN
jgi:hypothetical protein